jgi:hypothetical protein
MTFQDLVKEVTRLKCDEQRSVTEDYCEIVISGSELAKLNELLTSYFGPPLKMQGEKPSLEAHQHAEAYGGIRSNQTMYFRNLALGLEIALIWPWSSGTSFTVKIIWHR